MRKLRRHKVSSFGGSVSSAAMLVFSVITFIVALWVVMAVVRVVAG